MSNEVKKTASDIRNSIQLSTQSKRFKKFQGSGYAWILAHFADGEEFTVAEVQEGLIEAGILKKNASGHYNDYASDCITRMMRTSDASEEIQRSYINWTETVQKEGRNDEGLSVFSLTRRGMALGRKLIMAGSVGVNIRGHHLAKRIDKQMTAPQPAKKRGFRKEKGYDVLARTKAVRSRMKKKNTPVKSRKQELKKIV
jgi:hypothetical protein